MTSLDITCDEVAAAFALKSRALGAAELAYPTEPFLNIVTSESAGLLSCTLVTEKSCQNPILLSGPMCETVGEAFRGLLKAMGVSPDEISTSALGDDETAPTETSEANGTKIYSPRPVRPHQIREIGWLAAQSGASLVNSDGYIVRQRSCHSSTEGCQTAENALESSAVDEGFGWLALMKLGGKPGILGQSASEAGIVWDCQLAEDAINAVASSASADDEEKPGILGPSAQDAGIIWDSQVADLAHPPKPVKSVSGISQESPLAPLDPFYGCSNAFWHAWRDFVECDLEDFGGRDEGRYGEDGGAEYRFGEEEDREKCGGHLWHAGCAYSHHEECCRCDTDSGYGSNERYNMLESCLDDDEVETQDRGDHAKGLEFWEDEDLS